MGVLDKYIKVTERLVRVTRLNLVHEEDMKKKTKRNPADLTIRNARAYYKRFAQIENDISLISDQIKHIMLIQSDLLDENEAEKAQLKKIMTYFQNYFIKRKK